MDAPRLAVSSTRKDWETKGSELFTRKKFLPAKLCFERAFLSDQVAIAKAYYLRDCARGVSGGSTKSDKKRESAFLIAADAFLECASSQATSETKRAYFRAAAGCFEAADRFSQAALAYIDGEGYSQAALIYSRKLGEHDKAIAVWKNHTDQMRQDVIETVIDAARFFYIAREQFEWVVRSNK